MTSWGFDHQPRGSGANEAAARAQDYPPPHGRRHRVRVFGQGTRKGSTSDGDVQERRWSRDRQGVDHQGFVICGGGGGIKEIGAITTEW